MKNVLKALLGLLLICVSLFYAFNLGKHYGKKHHVETIVDTIYVKEPALSDFDILTLAIMKTESEFNIKAIGNNSFGVLQITPIYVKECNRLIGEDIYTIDDAFDLAKSLDMFSIIQDKYNPSKDIMRAIELHNPNGKSIGYPDKVIRNYNSILRYENARKIVAK